MTTFPAILCRRLRLGVKRNTTAAIKSTARDASGYYAPSSESRFCRHSSIQPPVDHCHDQKPITKIVVSQVTIVLKRLPRLNM